MSTSFQQGPASNEKSIVRGTTNKEVLTTSNPFEQRFGYHRAVRRGPMICVSGTTALKLLDDVAKGAHTSKVRHPGDAYKQAMFAMQRCVKAVNELGGRIEDVVRVRMYVAKHEDCSAVGQAFKESFGTTARDPTILTEDSVKDMIGVAATMIVVPSGFVDEDMLVEVEVDAWCI